MLLADLFSSLVMTHVAMSFRAKYISLLQVNDLLIDMAELILITREDAKLEDGDEVAKL